MVEEKVVDPLWLRDFDMVMKSLFAIDHVDAGLGNQELVRYADLPARDAVLQFGEDYDLQRTDLGWR